METNYVGIDYGMGRANIDRNGIHYGVISQNEVLQAWADSSEPYYGETETDEETDDFSDPISFTLNDGEYIAECGDSGDIFITKSPYYTLCQFCSPCAPGAGYLMNTVKDGIKAYCFDKSWFDDEIAPYPVYRVSDNTLIE